jgi:hypothetical protein
MLLPLLLQAAATKAQPQWQAAALRILEALVAAGFRPIVYLNVRIRPQGANWPSWGFLAPWLDARYPHQHWLSTPLLHRFDPFDFHRQHPLSRQGSVAMHPAPHGCQLAGSWLETPACARPLVLYLRNQS